MPQKTQKKGCSGIISQKQKQQQARGSERIIHLSRRRKLQRVSFQREELTKMNHNK